MKQITVVLILVLLLVVAVALFPDEAQSVMMWVDNAITDLKEVKLVEISGNDLNFSLGGGFSLPRFDISLDAAGVPTFDISIWIIILAVVAIIVSAFVPVVSLLTTLAFSGVGIYVSLQIADVYKGMLSSGVDTWQAAVSCFWVMFFVVFAVISNGLFGIEGTVMQMLVSKAENAAALGILLSLIFGAIIAFITAGIGYLLLGFGWAGAIILVLVLSIIYAILEEIANLYMN